MLCEHFCGNFAQALRELRSLLSLYLKQFRVQGLGFRALGFRVQGLGFRALGFPKNWGVGRGGKNK